MRELERAECPLIHLGFRRFDLAFAHSEPGLAQIEPVEFQREIGEHLVALLAHPRDDRCHLRVDIGSLLALFGEQRCEALLEFGIGGLEPLRHGGGS